MIDSLVVSVTERDWQTCDMILAMSVILNKKEM